MRILILIGAVFALYWSIRILSKSSPQFTRQLLRNLAIAAVVVVLLFLLATGRLNWLGALLIAAIPLLRKASMLWQWLPWLRKVGQGGASNAGAGRRTSTVTARYLKMQLDPHSGNIDGEVLEGRYQGRLLSQMSLSDLLALHAELASDADSAALLQAFLDRIHPQWREHTSARDADGFSSGDMNLSQALEILGLGNNPTREEVIKSHRRLMQKLHPDQGGSTYLATKVNLAKQCVLAHLDAAQG